MAVAQDCAVARALLAKLDIYVAPYVVGSRHAMAGKARLACILEAIVVIETAAIFNWGGM